MPHFVPFIPTQNHSIQAALEDYSGGLNLYAYLHLFLEKTLLEENTSKPEGVSLKDKKHSFIYRKLKHSSNMFLFKLLHLRKQMEKSSGWRANLRRINPERQTPGKSS